MGGVDNLKRGLGRDTFLFFELSDAPEVIQDFQRGKDKIYLGFDSNLLAPERQRDFDFIDSAAFKPGQLRFANSVLYGEFRGDTVADFQVVKAVF